jgi:pilus assembly protein Flp/PilA
MQYLLNMIVAIQLRVADMTDKDRGATATEYALLVSLIAVAIIIGVSFFGSSLGTFFHGLAFKVGMSSAP